jgi:hypothetical protein
MFKHLTQYILLFFSRKSKDELVWSYAKGEIGRHIFLKLYFKDIGDRNVYCQELLQHAVETKDGPLLQTALLLIIATYTSIVGKATDLACILEQDWHCHHEDIARLLQQFKNPLTVDNLYRAVQLNFEHLAYDDTYQFARKCIKALSAIDDENAIDKLHKLSDNKNLQIASYAKKELKYKNLI